MQATPISPRDLKKGDTIVSRRSDGKLVIEGGVYDHPDHFRHKNHTHVTLNGKSACYDHCATILVRAELGAIDDNEPEVSSTTSTVDATSASE